MDTLSTFHSEVGKMLGDTVLGMNRLHGGDLSDVFLVQLESGQRVVAKTGKMVDREARMLRAIHAAGAPAPRVLGQSGDILLLEALDQTEPNRASWRALGHALRTLHGCEGDAFGWDEDYSFGPVGIQNDITSDWPRFWAERRLLCAVDMLPREIARKLEALATRLPDLLPRRPTPSLLHGDLWAGNALFAQQGHAYLIDPACYFGHHEVDLAMLNLFGRPDPGFYDGYGEIDPGLEERRAIYQLWPALVHLRLFGSRYRDMVESRLSALGM